MSKLLIFLMLLTSLGLCEEPADSENISQLKLHGTDRKIILEELFFSGPDEPSDGFENGIRIKGISIPDETAFYKEMKPNLGMPVTLELLEKIRLNTIDYYKRHNYPVVGVFLPAGQDISDGSVHFIILEGKLGKVKSEGARWFPNQRIAETIRTKPNKPIEWTQIHADVEWINNNPFRKTKLIFEPGDVLGETDIQLVTEDKFPLRVYGGYENTGNLIAGPSRYLSGISWGNVLKSDHQMNVLFFTAPTLEKWWGLVGSYVAPLPWRNVLQLNGAYVKTRPDVGQDLDMNGVAWQVTGRYWVPFYTQKINHQFAAGYDFKRTNNFLNFATSLIFNHFIDISQFVAEYEGTISNSFHTTFFNVTLFVSPGQMTAFNKTEYFVQERPGTNAGYVYGKVRLDEVIFLPHQWSWAFNGLYQQASTHLLPSEELSLGGFATVRGYEENEVIGDNGILIKNELRTPPFRLPSFKKLRHELQFLGFSDLGWSYDVDHTVLTGNTRFLTSLGLGARYTFGTYVAVRFDYGWQLRSIHRLEDEPTYRARGHFGGTLSF